MRHALIFVLVALSACNTPSVEFMGVTPVEVRVAGSNYRVFRSEGKAQALRLNPEMRPNRNAEAKITQAIEIGTGCTVSGPLKGDVVMATAPIRCDGAPMPQALEIECEVDTVLEKLRCLYL